MKTLILISAICSAGAAISFAVNLIICVKKGRYTKKQVAIETIKIVFSSIAAIAYFLAFIWG